jgi:superfamily II DNA or RNA helicase
MKLFAHQQKLVDEFPSKHVLCWATGSGKSLTAIELANKANGSVLVVCPKALKKQWGIQLAQYSKVPWVVKTKEEFKRDVNVLLYHKCLVIDELHYWLGMKSALSKSLIFYLKKWRPENFYGLTATPYRSTPWDVYRMLEIMGQKVNWFQFYRQFFYEVEMGMRKIPMAKKTQEAKDQLIHLIKSVGSTVTLEECFDVPEQTFEVIYVELTKAQEKAIEKIDRVMPIERYVQEHQIVGGVTKGDEYVASERFESNKVSVLLELIKDNPRIIVTCKYRAELMMLKEIIEAEIPGKFVDLIHGDVKDRASVVDDINGRNDYVLLVAAQCGEGYGIPACPLMVFYSHDWALVSYVQMIGRIQRANNLKKNTYISLVCKDTIDEDVYKTVVIDKADFHGRIYDK